MPETGEHTSISILFWNLHKNDETYPLIGQAVEEYGVDICVFAEAPDEIENTLPELLPYPYVYHPLAEEQPKIRYFHNNNVRLKTLEEKAQLRGSMVAVLADGKKRFNLAACHLFDPINYSDTRKELLASKFSEFIRTKEAEIDDDRTIVIGDFNMNPFEVGVADVGCFNAVMSKGIASKRSCIFNKDTYPYFYNPMWYYLGHPLHINGTIYNHQSPYKWNLFDQVLLRPSLMDSFTHDSLKIITEINGSTLLTSSGLINSKISDHLPISITLKI